MKFTVSENEYEMFTRNKNSTQHIEIMTESKRTEHQSEQQYNIIHIYSRVGNVL